jgi:uncharacterized protein
MARAGFTAIHAGKIRFGKDGRWYCDGEPIANPAICRLYARTMTVGADGRARLELGEDRAEVEIEDTPWVVTGVEGDPRAGFTVVLNDDTREPLDLASLRLSSEPVPYCRVKGGRVEARLLRNAYYALMRHAEPTPEGACVLRAGGHQVALGSGAA